MSSQFGIAIRNKVSAILTYLLIVTAHGPPVIFIVARAWPHDFFIYCKPHFDPIHQCIEMNIQKVYKMKSVLYFTNIEISDSMHPVLIMCRSVSILWSRPLLSFPFPTAPAEIYTSRWVLAYGRLGIMAWPLCNAGTQVPIISFCLFISKLQGLG